MRREGETLTELSLVKRADAPAIVHAIGASIPRLTDQSPVRSLVLAEKGRSA
jgi:hypothetical protein